jgi:DNA uptake protein ComE-like DNA-binding protein
LIPFASIASASLRGVGPHPGTCRFAKDKLLQTRLASSSDVRGSVLIIVMWVCLGLVALTVYFADSMSSEFQAAGNRSAEVIARQAVAGGTRYAAYVLSQFAANGAVPHIEDYKSEDLPVGDASFWFLGRDLNQRPSSEPVFGLVDEASKLNLNTATRGMLESLPGMTPELAEAIVSWRARNQAGAGDSTYGRLDPPRLNKGGPFETVDELRLVYGATLEIILGEDTNRNGVLDENENDNDRSAPRDDGDGVLQPGILEYVTVYSRQPNTRANGSRRINITTNQIRQQQLNPILQQRFGGQRAGQIMNALGSGELRSVAEFMVASRMTTEEFAQIRADITASNGTTVQGLVNVNTASETVLACIPGIGIENAPALVAYRLAHPEALTSMAWITEILPRNAITRAGPYITDQSYQFSADVVGVGRLGRGFCREKTVFDLMNGTPRIVYHQDLTAYGWALGLGLRQMLREARDNRT